MATKTTRRKATKDNAPIVAARAAEIFGAPSSIFQGRARVSTLALQKGVSEMIRRVYATVPQVAPLDPRHPQIKVTYIGDQACARYSWARSKSAKLSVAGCINLPAMGEADDMVPRVIADQYTGYSLHEMGHFLYTPPHGFSGTIRQQAIAHGVSEDFAQSVINALEDVAIERDLIRSGYAPGAGHMLRGLVEKCIGDVPADAYGSIKAFPVTLAFALRGYTPNTDALVAALPPPLREIYDYAERAMRALPPRAVGDGDGMAGLAAVSDEVLRRLAALRERAPQQPQPEPGKGNSEPGEPSDAQDGDGEPGEPTDGDGEPGEPTDGDGEPSDAQDGDADPMGEPGDKGSSTTAPSLPPLPAQPADATPNEPKQPEPAPAKDADKGEDKPDNAPTKDSDVPALDVSELNAKPITIDMQPEQAGEPGSGASGLDNDAIRVVTAAPAPDWALAAEQQAITKALSGSAKIAHSLRALLDTSARDSREGGKRSGRLDASAFARIATGAETVFERREYRDGTDAAVTILIDRSSSMSGSRIESARTLASALSKIVSGCAGVRCEVLGFHSGGGGRGAYGDANTMADAIAQDIGSSEDQQEISATFRGDCTITIYKTFAESHGLAVKRLAQCGGSGGTPDAAALAYAVARLSKQTAGMKILIYLADGEGSPDHVLARVIKRAERSGLLLIGIGINAELNDAFSCRTNVEDVANLGKSGLAALLGVLARGETAQAISAGGDD